MRQLGTPEWEGVRSEILTPEEFEHDCEREGAGVVGVAAGRSTTDGNEGRRVGDDLLSNAFHDPLTVCRPGRFSTTASTWPLGSSRGW